jgi:dTDP-D-glucose 4,6-dehydratase
MSSSKEGKNRQQEVSEFVKDRSGYDFRYLFDSRLITRKTGFSARINLQQLLKSNCCKALCLL